MFLVYSLKLQYVALHVPEAYIIVDTHLCNYPTCTQHNQEHTKMLKNAHSKAYHAARLLAEKQDKPLDVAKELSLTSNVFACPSGR